MFSSAIFIGITLLVLLALTLEPTNLGYQLAVGCLGGTFATFWYEHRPRIFAYFSPDAIWKRRIIKLCRHAIYNLDERFNISVSNESSLESLVVLTEEKYVWCLFETHLLANRSSGKERYPDPDEFKVAAQLWYSSYEQNKQLDRIQIASRSDMDRLVVEVHSWGVDGRPWLLTHCKPLWDFKNYVSKQLYNMHSKEYHLCNYLYRSYKLPPNNYGTQLMIDILSESSDE